MMWGFPGFWTVRYRGYKDARQGFMVKKIDIDYGTPWISLKTGGRQELGSKYNMCFSRMIHRNFGVRDRQEKEKIWAGTGLGKWRHSA